MVKPGYKQTEIGVIPEDWESKQIGSFARICMCKRIFADQTAEVGEIPFYKIGTFGGKPDAYISKALYTEYKNKYSYPKKGDVLISAAGTLGRTVVFDGTDSYFQDSNIVWLDIDKAQISNEYLKHYYEVIKWAASEGSTISRLYNGIIESTNIAVPPLTEQKRIAEALSDMDELISSLEKLIEKKKAIKQGTMQELLTGKRRLPGFSGEWKEKRVGDICKIVMGQSPDSKYYNNDRKGLPLIQGNADIESRKTIIRSYTTQVTKKACRGEIIFTVRAPVGNVARATFDCCLGRGVCALKDAPPLIYQCLIFLEPHWKEISSGSTFDSISTDTLENTKVFLPEDVQEGNCISSILEEIDKEIIVIEKKLGKSLLVKQGMMQQLLTGNIRFL